MNIVIKNFIIDCDFWKRISCFSIFHAQKDSLCELEK